MPCKPHGAVPVDALGGSAAQTTVCDTPMAPPCLAPPVPFLSVLGHSNIDVQLHVEQMPGPNQSAPVQDRRTVYGGTAANIARHAAGLGVATRLWSRVGVDFPPEWKAGLEDDGVDLSCMDFDPAGRTPTCYILTDADDAQAYCMDQGAMADMVAHPPTAAVLAGLTGWLHVATGDPAAYAKIMDDAKAAGVRVAFDPGQELRFMYDARSFEQLLDKADVLFLNDAEYALACDYMRYGDPAQFLDHVDAVVITHGSKGASLYRNGAKPLQQPAFVAAAIDPTGAGDALRAGWYAALAEGHDMQTALAWGQAAAAVAVEHLGPQSHVVRRADLQAHLPALPSA